MNTRSKLELAQQACEMCWISSHEGSAMGLSGSGGSFLFSSFLFLLPLFVSFFLLLFFFVFRREIDRVSLYNPLLVLTLLETGVFRARPRLLEDCFALLSLLLESDLTQGHG